MTARPPRKRTLRRRATKLIFATAMLATGGTGVYQLTTGDENSWASQLTSVFRSTDGAPGVSLTPDPAVAKADLAAVADAWVDNVAPQALPKDRSGYATQTSATTSIEPAVMPQVQLPVSVPTVSEQGTDRYAFDSSPSPLPMSEPVEVLTELATEMEPPIARGQGPSSEANATPDVGPNPLRASGDQRRYGSDSQRAREAFGEDASDRLGGNATAERQPTLAAVPDRAEPNPFGSAPPSNTELEPLPKAGLPLEEVDPSRSEYYAPATNRRPGRPEPRSARLERSYGDRGISGPSSPPGESRNASIEGSGRPGERALEGPQKPSLAIQKFAPEEIQVGKRAKFVVKVRNEGDRPANDVVIRDEVPEGTRLVNTTPQAEQEGRGLVWRLGTLSAGEERTVEIQLMPTEEGELGSVATVSFAAQASVKTRCTMPQLAIRMTSPKTVMIGQELQVKIELKNPGSGDATGVMLLENVPDNVRHASGPALEFEIGTLRAGETREMNLTLTAEKPGKVINTLTARADGNLQVEQQVEFEVLAPAIEVEVEGPRKRYLERPATYEIRVSNPGTATAEDVQIVTKLPKEMQFLEANNMGEYDASTHAIYWSLAELPKGEQGIVELTAMPIEAGDLTLQVESKARQGLSDETKQQILVEGLSAIMFEVIDVEDPIEVGGETTYEIRVVNQGSKAATNVRVVVNLPPAMQFISAEGETRHAVQPNGIVFEPLSKLAPKADTLYQVRVQGIRAGDQRIAVLVSTEDIPQPIRKEESTRVFGDE